jgi:putative flippase GtrA
MVGVINTLLYMVSLYVFLDILEWPALIGATIAFAVTIGFYYWAHRYFTFRSHGPIAPQVYRLLPVTALNYLFSTALVTVLSRNQVMPAGWIAAISGGATAGLGYLFAYLWIFVDGRGEI